MSKIAYVLYDVYGAPKFVTEDLNTAEVWVNESPDKGYEQVDII